MPGWHLIGISIGQARLPGAVVDPGDGFTTALGAGIDPKKSPATERLSVIVCDDCERAKGSGDDCPPFAVLNRQRDKAGRQPPRLSGLEGLTLQSDQPSKLKQQDKPVRPICR
jgi:hypothetical protein